MRASLRSTPEEHQAWQGASSRHRCIERHRLTATPYFSGELVMMLERAGFTGVDVRGAYNDLPPTVDDTFLLYLATAG